MEVGNCRGRHVGRPLRAHVECPSLRSMGPCSDVMRRVVVRVETTCRWASVTQLSISARGWGCGERSGELPPYQYKSLSCRFGAGRNYELEVCSAQSSSSHLRSFGEGNGRRVDPVPPVPVKV